MRDLRPYICTYENCKDADQQYDSLRDWINHEAVMHRSKPGVAKSRNEDSGSPEPRTCPFCYEDAGPHHIAVHLRRVACFSLPRFIGEEDISVGDSEMSNKAEMRSNDTVISEANYESSVGGTGSASETEERNINRTTNTTSFAVEDLGRRMSRSEDIESKMDRFHGYPNTKEILDLESIPENVDYRQIRARYAAYAIGVELEFDADKDADAAEAVAAAEAATEAAAAAAAEAEAAKQEVTPCTASAPAEKRKPIKYKDCIGRKFEFPFELADTWQVCLPYFPWWSIERN